MAGTRRFSEDLGRFNRLVYTTPRALAATQLAVAVALALLVAGIVALVSDIGRWGWLLAVLPLAHQVRHVVEAANRRRTGDAPDLGSESLIGADLTDADLGSCDLRQRDLSDARLINANLVGVDLSGASVPGARFRRADLSYGSLEGADGVKASFYHARLVETDLRRVDARRAGFERADLRGADLAGANLLGAAFGGADVRGANFTGAKLAPDALTDARLDDTTILADGAAADQGPVSPLARFVPSAGLLVGGALWTIARPAFHGLAWASLLTGSVVAVETSGGGLGEELAILTRTEPAAVTSSGGGQVRRVPPQDASSESSNRGIPELDDDGTSSAGETALVPPPGTDPGDDPIDGAADGADGLGGGGLGGPDAEATSGLGTTAGGASDLAGEVGTDEFDDGSALIEATTVPALAAAQADPDAGASTTAAPTTTQPEPVAQTTESSTTVPAELTEVEVPVTSALAGLQRVQVVVSSDGGASTVTSATSLGQVEPRSITGPAGWELMLPSGEVRVQVTPSDASAATACQILVDGAERSFQSGLAGQTSTCIVDLDPAG